MVTPPLISPVLASAVDVRGHLGFVGDTQRSASDLVCLRANKLDIRAGNASKLL